MEESNLLVETMVGIPYRFE